MGDGVKGSVGELRFLFARQVGSSNNGVFGVGPWSSTPATVGGDFSFSHGLPHADDGNNSAAEHGCDCDDRDVVSQRDAALCWCPRTLAGGGQRAPAGFFASVVVASRIGVCFMPTFVRRALLGAFFRSYCCCSCVSGGGFIPRMRGAVLACRLGVRARAYVAATPVIQVAADPVGVFAGFIQKAFDAAVLREDA